MLGDTLKYVGNSTIKYVGDFTYNLSRRPFQVPDVLQIFDPPPFDFENQLQYPRYITIPTLHFNAISISKCSGCTVPIVM